MAGTIHYTATVGTITWKRTDDKATGVVMYTAYTVDADRGDLKGETKKGGNQRAAKRRQKFSPAGNNCAS